MATANLVSWAAGRNGGAVRKVARSLGWFSIGLGAAEILAPLALTKLTGNSGRSRESTRRGLRRVAAGVGLLAKPPALARLLASSNGGVSAKTVAAVAGVTVAGVIAAKKLGAFGKGERAVRHSASVAVNRLPEDCYRYWRDPQKLPAFFKHLKEVRANGDDRLEWVARGPNGQDITCAVAVTEDTGETIAWRSVGDARITQSGWVRFEPMPGGKGTVVRLHIQYEAPAATPDGAMQQMLGRDPALRVRKTLLRFKQMMETGEIATTEGQPAGRPSGTTWLDRMASV
ncbi:MAG TPA: SRPBCC family protein [Candidatus Acidoferrales bacterium]|nr:SRPBCC family protein [Candidatus Acidoferrales bacterium]